MFAGRGLLVIVAGVRQPGEGSQEQVQRVCVCVILCDNSSHPWMSPPHQVLGQWFLKGTVHLNQTRELL